MQSGTIRPVQVLRRSAGVTPGALISLLSQQFGAPHLHRDASLNGSITYEWDAQYGIHIRVNEPVRPAGADTFLVVVTRFLAAPASIPTAADDEHWLERTVSLLTGSDLLAAQRMQAVQLVDAAMKPDPVLGGGCATSFSTSGVTVKQPIAYDKTLFLKDAASDCDDAAFVQLSMTIWQRPPVTVQALVERLEAKLGPPTLSRDFSLQSLRYEWTTGLGAKVGVSEFVGIADRIFIVHLSRT